MATTPKLTWAGKRHALLTETTAMSCWSWSLPARFSCPGRRARDEGDICYGCYAEIGCYNYDVVAAAQAARFAWTRQCLQTGTGRREWIATMVIAITKCATADGYFRWHDSGDIFSPQYCEMIRRVCKATPHIKHWLPTRSWRLGWETALVRLNSLRNVKVRPSALEFGDSPPTIKGLTKGTTAHLDGERCPKGAMECPKASPGNEAKSCEAAGCRVCWGGRRGVSFMVHGRKGHHKVHAASAKEVGRRRNIIKDKMSYIGLEVVDV